MQAKHSFKKVWYQSSLCETTVWEHPVELNCTQYLR